MKEIIDDSMKWIRRTATYKNFKCRTVTNCKDCREDIVIGDDYYVLNFSSLKICIPCAVDYTSYIMDKEKSRLSVVKTLESTGI